MKAYHVENPGSLDGLVLRDDADLYGNYPPSPFASLSFQAAPIEKWARLPESTSSVVAVFTMMPG